MPQPIKKRSRSQSKTDFKETRQKIRTLEASLSDKSNLNNLVVLLDIAQDDASTAQGIHAAIHALFRVYTRLIQAGDLGKKKDKGAHVAVTQWLRDQYKTYLRYLQSLLKHEEPGLQVSALNILMTNLKVQSEYQRNFTDVYYRPVIEAVVWQKQLSDPLFKEFLEKYVNAYDDLRFHFYTDVAEIITAARPQQQTQQKDESKPEKKKQKTAAKPKPQGDLARLAQTVFRFVEGIRSTPTEPEEIDEFFCITPATERKQTKKNTTSPSGIDEDDMMLLGEGLDDEDEDENDEQKPKEKQSYILQLKNHKRAFADCWINLLRLPLSEEIYKKTLLILHKRILPHMMHPNVLMDFLSDSYEVGGSVSLLALNGLFVLITEHSLEFPDFYPKLYNLLDRDVMHVKYRSRFFRLLDIFLSSTLLPVGLVAAFVKRLARLSLTAPPAAIVIIIPFIYNLMRRHPTCMTMIHRNDAVGEAEDPYVYEEKDPYKCKAMESSLWEVQTLAEHYYANVSTLAKIFSDKFLKPKYDLEDFMDHTYTTFFDNEVNRKQKKAPALAFEKPGECTWEI
ncbi:CBF/Mak21 family-domain-containing protein [Syncephalastrum racemosum]|uniref:CBF/Mak21 family-domain-containing protein n=1 Tax=Syncephalastrum racemosum TaxID=13706 RepID=A0A1X2HDM9_SYNRA|nr:CBF/Mak21 family-domain-containing protein [Syncephalastrum racemosum]